MLAFKNILFALVVPGTVGVYVPLLLSRGHAPASGAAAWGSFFLFGAASALAVWCMWYFAARGRGTPLPLDPPRQLVVDGPYRYVRNPMYLALFSALIGWNLLYQTAGLLIYALAVAAAVTLFVMVYEEPHLQRMFGAEYDAYRARVPRWFPRPWHD